MPRSPCHAPGELAGPASTPDHTGGSWETMAYRASSLGLWAKLAPDTYRYCGRFRNLLGYEPGDPSWPQAWAGLHQWAHPDDRAALHEALQQAASGMWPVDIECRLPTKQGSYRWIHLRGRLETEPFTALVGTAEDVTNRVELAQELSHSQEQALALLDETRTMQSQLVETSRIAGMAEVATGVLHDIGNVLNSIGVASDAALVELDGMRLDGLLKAQAALVDARDSGSLGDLLDSPRGAKLVEFIARSLGDAQARRERGRQSMTRLRTNVDHARSILRAQQKFARSVNVEEVVQLGALEEDLRQINQDTLASVCFSADVPDGLHVHTDRHKLLQILVNLVRNAAWAASVGPASKARVQLVVRSQQEHLSLQVIDNGIGIAACDLDRIFQHGFSKREEGHGFGLHSSANVARQLGGTLSVHSDGPGHGATFTLLLPTGPSHD